MPNNSRVTQDAYKIRAVAAPTQTVTLSVVANRCGGGECPTIYKTDRGTLVVQGYSFEPAAAGTSVPTGEQMVEIPIALLADYLQSQQ